MTKSSLSGSSVWIAIIAAASTIISLVLACATPFPALAALAAGSRRKLDGLLLVGAAWVAAQAIGICIQGQTLDAEKAIWGATLLAGGMISVLAAHAIAQGLHRTGTIVRASATFAGAFVGFKAVVLVTTLLLDSGHGAFAADVLARQFVRNGLIFAGLVVLQRGLGTIGLPAARPAHA
ncbi:hypothetical protein [Allosphingosinicella deserti]|uniref:hypothetical protein n=1 Tax=Allosphingosinicella deserti TaxID=2116704 RepID=UPI0011B1CECB|nr:hypothetical protein [Sphingomonas deserti]